MAEPKNGSKKGKKKRITPQQKRFAQEYIKTSNIFQSALKAGYSRAYAKSKGHELVAREAIQEYIAELMEKAEDNAIADAREVLIYLTSVLRGEIKDENIVTDGDTTTIIETRASVQQRNKAAELLGKRYSLYTEKQEIELSVPVFLDDIPEDDEEDE